jgi:predicted Zn-dependent peptidase
MIQSIRKLALKRSFVSMKLSNGLRRFLLVAVIAVIGSVQARQTGGQGPDRSKPPELGPPPSLRLPMVQHLKLSNGLPVVLMEKHDLPLVQMELVVFAGSAMDPAGKNGLASLASTMMEEGAGKRNALELADAIDFLGASINASSGQHTSGVSLHTPLSKLDSALGLFADIALHPTFPKEELERHRKEILTTLAEWHDEPRAIASVLFNRSLFGEKHPYGLPTIGNEQSIRAFTAEDLEQFHARYYHPNNAALIVVGDVTPKTILNKLEKLFAQWKAAPIPKSSWTPVDQVKQRKIWLVDKPGAAQSVIRIGRIGAQRVSDDYYALLVLNTILGGSFTSRLNQNLREQHGYSYGAGSSFDFRPMPGPFFAGASVQTDVTDKALSEFMKELANIMQPVTDEELKRAKNYLALGYPGNFQSVAQLADQLAEMVIYKLPDMYVNEYTKNILAVTKDDLNRVSKKYLDPEKVNIVIVGDRQKTEQGVAALSIAPIQDLTIDDVLGKAPVVGE